MSGIGTGVSSVINSHNLGDDHIIGNESCCSLIYSRPAYALKLCS